MMPLPLMDTLIIVAMAVVCAVAVSLLSILSLRMLRHRRLTILVLIVVVAALAAMTAGILAVAQAMYISEHDFLVVITVTVVAAVISVILAITLTRPFVRSSRRVTELARRIGEGERIDEAPRGLVSAELNTLAEALATTSQKLASAHDEVVAIDASRRELMAWISHDLRSPLSGLRAMTEALEDGLAEDPARFHRQMTLQVTHLTHLVDDLFDLSKISSGHLALTLAPTSLHDLVSDTAAELSPIARTRGITLTAHTSPEHTVTADAHQVSKVIHNLLSNAIEHTPDGGQIVISTAAGSSEITLSVKDTGPGIPADMLERIFEPGWRGTTARTPSVHGKSGAGLGLAIVQGIVDAHAGQVRVENEQLGCRFDVTLPR